MKLPPIAYICWRDACVNSDSSREVPLDQCETLELHAIGWIECVSDEAVRIGLEYHDGAETSRIWQIVPNNCIKEIRCFNLPKRTKKNSKRPKK